MKIRKPLSRQRDFFAQTPEQMQWDKLPEQEQNQAQYLLVELVLHLFSQLNNNQKVDHHAAEDNR